MTIVTFFAGCVSQSPSGETKAQEFEELLQKNRSRAPEDWERAARPRTALAPAV